MNKITLVGTTHLTSKEEIVSIIEREKPQIIGVELCNTRLKIMVLGQVQLASNKDDSIMGKIANSIKEKAEVEKIEYGSDMVTASRYALENNIPLVLVDRPLLLPIHKVYTSGSFFQSSKLFIQVIQDFMCFKHLLICFNHHAASFHCLFICLEDLVFDLVYCCFCFFIHVVFYVNNFSKSSLLSFCFFIWFSLSA